MPKQTRWKTIPVRGYFIHFCYYFRLKIDHIFFQKCIGFWWNGFITNPPLFLVACLLYFQICFRVIINSNSFLETGPGTATCCPGCCLTWCCYCFEHLTECVGTDLTCISLRTLSAHVVPEILTKLIIIEEHKH